MRNAYFDVHDFHRTFDHPRNTRPVLQPAERVSARADWLDEEVTELREATTIAEQADAYIDIIYFAMGGLVEMGVNPDRLWSIVHGANMAKVWPDGTVRRREDGKIVKPDGWVAPDALIEAEIIHQQTYQRIA
jgi:predicted HAD superfamily Cof-like phosphohydrolase